MLPFLYALLPPFQSYFTWREFAEEVHVDGWMFIPAPPVAGICGALARGS